MLYALCPMLLNSAEGSLRKHNSTVLKPLGQGTFPVFVILFRVIEAQMDVHALDLPGFLSLKVPTKDEFRV